MANNETLRAQLRDFIVGWSHEIKKAYREDAGFFEDEGEDGYEALNCPLEELPTLMGMHDKDSIAGKVIAFRLAHPDEDPIAYLDSKEMAELTRRSMEIGDEDTQTSYDMHIGQLLLLYRLADKFLPLDQNLLADLEAW